MPRDALFYALLVACVLAACHPPAPPSPVLVREGFDLPSEWMLNGCVIADGVLVLTRAPSGEPSMAMRILPPLPDTGSLVVGVRARSAQADDALHIDLWGFGRDDPRQEMALQPSEMKSEFAPAGTAWPSGSSDQGIWLRVFSASGFPVEVDGIDLVHVPADVWRRVSAPGIPPS